MTSFLMSFRKLETVKTLVASLISLLHKAKLIVESQEQLIDSVHPGVCEQLGFESAWLCDRAIFTPTNE